MSFTTAVLLSILFLLVAAILGGLIVYFWVSKGLQRSHGDHEKLALQNSRLERELSDLRANQAAMANHEENLRTIEELEIKLHKTQEACSKEKEKLEAELSALKTQIAPVSSHDADDDDSRPATGATQDKRRQALEKIKEKAKSFDYTNIGTAKQDEKDDLKIISGIGPFIEEKLNALGIFTFAQISKFTAKDVEQVTDAIEFFPGRIERDDWIKQANELVKK